MLPQHSPVLEEVQPLEPQAPADTCQTGKQVLRFHAGDPKPRGYIHEAVCICRGMKEHLIRVCHVPMQCLVTQFEGALV